MPYIDELLETVKRLFIQTYNDTITIDQGVHGDYSEFDPMFMKVLQTLEEKSTSVSIK